MTRSQLRILGILLVLGAIPGAAWAQASPPLITSTTPVVQNPTSADQKPEPQTAASLEEAKAAAQRAVESDLARVKSQLQMLPPVEFDLRPALHFYAATSEKTMTFEDITKSFDLINGPAPAASVTHADMLQYWHDKDLTPAMHVTFGPAVAAGAINFAAEEAKKIIAKGVEAIKNAKSENEIKAIRLQIDKELAALNGQVIK